MNTPRYEYSRRTLETRVKELTGLSTPYGMTARYAVKANMHPEIIATMHRGGMHFDASSSYEAQALLEQGIPGHLISLSSQQSPHNLPELLAAGVLFVATSFKQLELFLNTENRPAVVGVRINPDMGSGHNKRTTTGGVGASFGIWHEYIPQIQELVDRHGVTLDRLHIHIGSGADSKVWGAVMDRLVEIVQRLPTVTSVDIGGGFKVHRYGDENEADMQDIFRVFSEKLEAFAEKDGRKLHVEIEPGTYAVASVGTLVATIDDIVDTGENGHTFLRLNTGMNDFLRSTMYGAQHRIEVMSASTIERPYIVVGHNCESGDIFTPAPHNPEELEPRMLREAHSGDEVRIYDVGAYGASMRARGYNAFPDAIEVMVD